MPAAGIAAAPIAGALGAEVTGIDLSQPPEAAAAEQFRRLLRRHLVLVLRHQSLSPDSLVAAARALGPVCRVPYVEPMAGNPDVIAVLKEADETGIATFGGTWHSDFSFLPAPPGASLLYAAEVPEHGGDTLWCSMVRAFADLSPGMQRLLRGLTAVHTGAPYGVADRPAGDVGLSRSIRMRRGDPAADREQHHPVVRRDPDSGQEALFVNPVYTIRFAGMSREESRPLLDFLQAHAVRPEFTCRVRWQPGTLVVWDNRWTMHLAINDYDGRRRLLYRTTVAGEPPLAAA